MKPHEFVKFGRLFRVDVADGVLRLSSKQYRHPEGDDLWEVESPYDYASYLLAEVDRLAQENEDLRLRLEQAP